LVGESDVDYIERNCMIIRERMIEQMEHSLALGRKLIDTELDTGILNFLVRPVVKRFYDYWVQYDASKNTKKQIDITLEAGRQVLLNGNSEESFDKIIDETFPKYLEVDQVSRNCSKNHENFERLVEITKDTYVNYLEEVIKLLNVREDIDNYGDLCREAFKTEKRAKDDLVKQLDFNEMRIKVVEEDPSIIKLSVGRGIIVKALRSGFEETKREFYAALDDTYE